MQDQQQVQQQQQEQRRQPTAAFPVKTATFEAAVGGVCCALSLSAYADRLLVVASAVGALGVVLQVGVPGFPALQHTSWQQQLRRPHQGTDGGRQRPPAPRSAAAPAGARRAAPAAAPPPLQARREGPQREGATYRVDTLLGAREDPLPELAARALAEALAAAGCDRPLLLCLGVRGLTQQGVRDLVRHVLAHPVWA